MELERVQQASARDNHWFQLFFDGQRANQRRLFFSRFPFGQLTETFLSGPN